jgi:glycosyltransferase involved in cell wall biosynthesis
MSKLIRVLYEIHPHTLGGTERFLSRLLPELDRRRFEPVVVSQNRGLPLRAMKALGFQTRAIPDYFKLSGIQRLANFIIRHEISLVQSNYYSSNLAMAANLASVPHIWRLGGHVDVGSGVRTGRESAWALDLIRLMSKVIICNSRFVRSQFTWQRGSPQIKVIPNGILIPTVVKHQGQTDRPFSVGMIAHFTPQKRHVDFIRAAERISRLREDVSFTILGTAYKDSESRTYSRQVAVWGRDLQRRGKLTISDFVRAEGSVYEKFDCVVLPSVRESFSNAILESMAAGVPVVAARSGGHPELVEHGETGLLVSPGQPEALVQAILRLLNDRKALTRMGRAARKRARACFSLAKCARSYESVYLRVVLGA